MWLEPGKSGRGLGQETGKEPSPLFGSDSLISCARLEASTAKAAFCTYSCKNILSDSTYELLLFLLIFPIFPKYAIISIHCQNFGE